MTPTGQPSSSARDEHWAAPAPTRMPSGDRPTDPSGAEPRFNLVHRLRTQAGHWSQELVVLAAIVVLFIVVGVVNPMFLSTANVRSIFAGNAYIAVAAIGMSMVIICGHIDVSVGSLIGVLAMVSGSIAVAGYPVWMAWLAPVVIGLLVNAFMGALVAYGRVPSIVVTLGMYSILKGGLISVTGGAWISDLPPEFMIAQFRWFGIPSTVWFMVVMTILAAAWMHYSVHGRSIYALGSNAEAARAATAGDPVDRTVQPRADDHHGGRGRRGQHSRRPRAGGGRHAGGDPVRDDQLVAHLSQRVGLLAARRAGPADPGHRAGRHRAPARLSLRPR